MLNMKQINLQYVTDENGEKKAVIFPIEEFIELLEDLDDLAAIAERRDEPVISHADLIANLKKDALL